MEYIREFENVSAYEAEKDTLGKPNVAWCVEENEIKYTKLPHDFSKDYLTFEAIESGTFKFSGNDVSYSTDNGTTWATLQANEDSPTVSVGNKIMFKATLTPSTSYPNYGIGTFSSTGRFNVIGNPMSLLYGDDFIGKTSLSGKNVAFRNLFSGCTRLTNAECLSLLATTLTEACYMAMFCGCTSLTAAPSLPATTVEEACYNCMFSGCTSLTTAPELPATTLANVC